jgi:hypothetical protein
MFNKKDPLVDSIKVVMEQNSIRREVERLVNEEFGVTSRKGLPHELHADYDSVLAEATEAALLGPLDEGIVKKIQGALGLRRRAASKKAENENSLLSSYGGMRLHQDSLKAQNSPKYNDATNKEATKQYKIAKRNKTRLDKVASGKKPFSEATELQEGSIRAIAKFIGRNTKKGQEKVNKATAKAAEAETPDAHANRIKWVKGEKTMKESFENFLRSKYLKD